MRWHSCGYRMTQFIITKAFCENLGKTNGRNGNVKYWLTSSFKDEWGGVIHVNGNSVILP